MKARFLTLSTAYGFSKAIDKVWYRRLVHTFEAHGNQCKLVNWIQNGLGGIDIVKSDAFSTFKRHSDKA